MPLTATFAADFARFEKGLQGAQVHLQVFDRAAKTAAKSLTREMESISGQKVAVEAAKMAEAVRRLGGEGGIAAGLLKLTDDELKRVTATMEAASAKAGKLGEALPASLKGLQKELDLLGARSQSTTGFLGSLGKAAGVLGPVLPIASVGAAAAAVVKLGHDAVEAGGQIQDLANRLGVSAGFIQEIQFVADQTGSSVETFSSAAFRLGVNVAEGTDKARSAIKDLGLSYDTLKGQLPEDQFRQVIKSLEGVEDAQERNRLGVALFGKQFAELAPAVAEGYSDMAESAWKMSDDTVKALDRLGDYVGKLGGGLKNVAGTILGNITRGAEDAIASATLDLEKYTSAQQILIKKTLAEGGALAPLLKQIEEGNKRIAAAAGQVPPSKSATDYVAALAEIDAKIKGLKPGQVAQLTAAVELGGDAAEKYAESIGLGAEGLDRFKDRAAKAKTEAERLQKAFEDSIVWGDGIQAAATWMDRLAASSRALELPNTKGLKDIFEFSPDVGMDSFEKALELRSTALTGFHDKHQKDIADIFEFSGDPGIAMFQANLDKIAKSFKGTFAAAFKDLPNVIMRSLEGGGDLGKSIGAMFGSKIFGEDSALTKSLTGGLTKGLGKTIGGAIGSMIPGLGTLLGAGVGALTDKLFGKLFGGEGKQVNKLRDQFTAAAGGIGALEQRAAAAGVTLERFYRAKSVKEYEAAIKDLDTAFKKLDANRDKAASLFDRIMEAGSSGIPAAFRPAIEQLTELGLLTDEQIAKLHELSDGSVLNVDQLKADIDLFKGRLESLGPAFQQAQIDKTAGQYINAIERMLAAGGDTGGILFDAKEEIAALVQEAMKFGTTLPANMQPWIDELVRSGNLVDANGKKIEDVSTLKFGEEMKTEQELAREGWEKITAAIQELVAELRGPLTDAINKVPRDIRVKVGTEYEDDGRASAAFPSPASSRTLSGGAASAARQALFGSSAAGAATIKVPVHIDGAQVAEATVPYIPGALYRRGL